MNIELQACSLEPSKRLEELGVKQDSLFYWHNIDTYPSLVIGDSTEWSGDRLISAFTVAELGEMLPDAIVFNGEKCFIKSQKKDNEYKIYIDNLKIITIFFSENEADVRAKMLIYLIENKLINQEIAHES